MVGTHGFKWGIVMNNKLGLYPILNDDKLAQTRGGKISLPIPGWSATRDLIWGLVDGLSGAKHKSRKKRGR